MKVLISFKKQDLYQCYILRRAHIYFELRKYKDIRKGKKIYKSMSRFKEPRKRKGLRPIDIIKYLALKKNININTFFSDEGCIYGI